MTASTQRPSRVSRCPAITAGLLATLIVGSAAGRPGGGQSFVGPSQQKPASAVRPAAPSPPAPQAPHVEPRAAPHDPAPSAGNHGRQWWKGSPDDPAPDSTEPRQEHLRESPSLESPQDPHRRTRTNAVVFGVFLLVIAGVLVVRGVRRARSGAGLSGAPGDEARSVASGPMPGDLLVGKYRVGAEVERDDLGVFFDAEEEALPRTVRLYVLRPEHEDSAVHRQRFTERAEAWMNAGPHDVTDFVSRTEGLPFAVILPRR